MAWAIALAYTGLAAALCLLVIAGIFLLENGSGTNPQTASSLRFSWRRRTSSKKPPLHPPP